MTTTDPKGGGGEEVFDPLAGHIRDTVEVVAAFEVDGTATSRLQKSIDRTTEFIARPALVLILLVCVAGWIVANLEERGRAIDPVPFNLLGLMATLVGLLIAILILVTQRREDRLAERRAQLTLELALISDKKSAKIIALLEEMRRDHPELANRIDSESQEMSKPTDPDTVLAAIDRGNDTSSTP